GGPVSLPDRSCLPRRPACRHANSADDSVRSCPRFRVAARATPFAEEHGASRIAGDRLPASRGLTAAAETGNAPAGSAFGKLLLLGHGRFWSRRHCSLSPRLRVAGARSALSSL